MKIGDLIVYALPKTGVRLVLLLAAGVYMVSQLYKSQPFLAAFVLLVVRFVAAEMLTKICKTLSSSMKISLEMMLILLMTGLIFRG